MSILKLSKHKRARVWLGEMPDLLYSASEVTERILVGADTKRDCTKKLVGLELFVPTGPKINYGMLGAEYYPTSSRDLLVRVLVPQGIGETVSWSIIDGSDEVRRGFEIDCTDSILDGATSALREHPLQGGTLCFNRAAYSQVGSSQAFFFRLAQTVVQIISLDIEDVNQDELSNLLDR